MSTKPIFRFYFKKPLPFNTYTYWDETTGIIRSSPTKEGHHLENAPIGWNDTEIKYSRSNKYWGLLREYTTQYKFVKEGAFLLRSYYYQYGLGAQLKLYVEKLVSTTQAYEFFFEGDFDFSMITDEKDFVGINIMEAGIVARIKALEDTEYPVELTQQKGALEVEIPPFLARGELKFHTGWPVPAAGTNTNAFNGALLNKLYCFNVETKLTPVADTPGNRPISFPNPVVNNGHSSQINEGWNTTLGSNAGNYLFRAQVDLKRVKVTAKIHFYFANHSGDDAIITGRIGKYSVGGGAAVTNIYASPNVVFIADGAFDNYTMDFDVPEFDMAVHDRIFIYITFSNGVSNHIYEVAWDNQNVIKITFQHLTEPFQFSAMRWIDVFKDVVRQVTDGQAVVDASFLTDTGVPYSRWLDTRPWQTCLTSGDAIRGINTKGYSCPVIKTSIADLFKDGDSRWSMGLAVQDNKIVLKPKSDFFDKDEVIHNLQEVADFRATHDIDRMYNTIKVGYHVNDFDSNNGREEYNTLLSFRTSIGLAKNELDILSPYRADIYGMYKTWADYVLDENKDSQNDNDIFIIDIAQAPTGTLYAPLTLTGTVSGILDIANTFNFGQTPKRNLLRNGSFIRSFLSPTTDPIDFIQGERNIALSTNFLSGIIDEDATVYAGSLASPFYRPVVFSVEVQSPENLIDLMKQKPYGCFRFTYRGNAYKGFPIDVGLRPAQINTYEFKLLCTPDTDLYQLVH